jgi:uncharacterized repeat protein (TIGR01451 family)
VINTVEVTGEVECQEDYIVTDTAWVNVICPPDEEDDGIVIVEKWVKPDCEEDAYANHIWFNYGEYDYVTYRIDILINESFTEPIFNLSVRDNLPQIEGLQYNNSYIRDEYDNPYEEYTFDMTDTYLFWNFTEALYPGELYSIYYCADVLACGDFENWVNVTGMYYDGGPCCPVDVYANDSAIVEVICGPGIDVIKEASLDGESWSTTGVDSYVDDEIWFRLTVENTGFEILEGVNVYDYLPEFLTFKEMIDDGDADVVYTNCENQTYDLRWFFTEIGIGETIEIIFTTDVTAVGSGSNIVTVQSCGGPGDSDSVDIDVEEGMYVEKTVSLNENSWYENVTVSTGGTVTWKINVSFFSSDPTRILHHIEIWDTLPDDVTYVEDSALVRLHDGTSFSQEPFMVNDMLFWDLNDELLESGEWLAVTFDTTIDADALGELENYVNVTGKVCDETYYESSDTAVIFVPIGTLIECEKLVRKDSGDDWIDEIDANLDEQISFKITVKNTGFGAMNHINIEDDLPDKLEYIEGSSDLYFDGETVTCEPLIIDGRLVWEDICTCIPNEDPEEIARYLLVGETVSITFDVRTISSGTAINQMTIDAKMCENAVPVHCSDDATVNIVVNPLVANIVGSYSGYVDEEIQLTGEATGGIPDYSYFWDLDEDGEFDDSTLQNPKKTWTEAGSYTVALKVVDDAGENDTDTATVIIENRDPNLYCSGSITLTDIEPGSTQTATITIENTGDPGSHLDWSIYEEPTWGEWTFSPNEGNDLTPEDGEQTIQVTLVVPDEKNGEFSGSIVIVNDDDSSDSCEISVSVATPHQYQHPFIQFLLNLIERFPILNWITEIINY